MTTKFYLHRGTTTNTGTLPTDEHSSLTSNASATPPAGNKTQRVMDTTIGVSAQTSLAGTTQATTTAQAMLMGMWESAPMSAQTLPTGTWTFSFAASEANINANYQPTFCLYVWRPGTGAMVGTALYDHAADATEPGTTQTALTLTTGSITGVAVNAGDILVLESWRDNIAQGNATARVETFFYDGTTEASTSNCASFLLCNGGNITIPVDANVTGVAAHVTAACTAGVAVGGRPYTVLQSKSAQNGGSGNVAVTFTTANLTAGTKIIAWVEVSCSSNFTTVVSSVKDGALNTWTKLAQVDNGAHTSIWLFALDTPAGDAGTKPTLTATCLTNFGAAILVQEVSGLLTGNTSAMLDGTPGTQTGTTSPATTGALSTAVINEYLTVAYGDPGDTITVTTPGGWDKDTTSIGPSSQQDLSVYSELSTGGAESASLTLSGTAADGWNTILAAFKLATTTVDANVTGVAAAVTAAGQAGTLAAGVSLTGTAAPVTVASPAGTASGSAGTTGTAAPVTVACGIGVATGTGGGSANVTGTAAAVTAAGGAGTASGSVAVTGTAAPVTAAASAGVASGSAATAGVRAAVTVAGGTGTFSAAAGVTGVRAAITVAGGTGTFSAAAAVTGVRAAITTAGGTGTASAAVSLTGISAPVTVQCGAGVATGTGAGAANVDGVAAAITVTAGTGTLHAGQNITGTAAVISIGGGTGALSGSQKITGTAALITVAGGAGTAIGGGATVPARSTATVTAAVTSTATATDPRDGASTVTAAVTSTTAVSDPRDGTAAVAAVTTSSPTVT